MHMTMIVNSHADTWALWWQYSVQHRHVERSTFHQHVQAALQPRQAQRCSPKSIIAASMASFRTVGSTLVLQTQRWRGNVLAKRGQPGNNMCNLSPALRPPAPTCRHTQLLVKHALVVALLQPLKAHTASPQEPPTAYSDTSLTCTPPPAAACRARRGPAPTHTSAPRAARSTGSPP